MAELKNIAVKKWIGDYSGSIPTPSIVDGVSIWDIAIDNSIIPNIVWRCKSNISGSPIWVKDKGKYIKTINSIIYTVLSTDEILLFDTSGAAANVNVALPKIDISFTNIPFTFKFINGVFGVNIIADEDDDIEEEPIFPYPDIEDEYYADMKSIKWTDYPLIKIYNEKWNDWDDGRIEKYDQEENLRKCPICRMDVFTKT